MDIVTRREAQRFGFRFYFTGEECNRGHLARRYVSSGRCIRCSPKSSGPSIIPAHITIMRKVIVPTRHVAAVVALINAYNAAEGITMYQSDRAFYL